MTWRLPVLVRLRCFNWDVGPDGYCAPKVIGDCFINLSAVTAIGPDDHGVRLVTVQGGAAYPVRGDEILAHVSDGILTEPPR